jgi:hypothetical protein
MPTRGGFATPTQEAEDLYAAAAAAQSPQADVLASKAGAPVGPEPESAAAEPAPRAQADPGIRGRPRDYSADDLAHRRARQIAVHFGALGDPRKEVRGPWGDLADIARTETPEDQAKLEKYLGEYGLSPEEIRKGVAKREEEMARLRREEEMKARLYRSLTL